MSKIINIHYFIDEDESHIAFESQNKFSVFKNILGLTQKINANNYDIFYNNKVITKQDDKTVSDLIGKDPRPFFKLIKKKIEHNFNNSIKNKVDLKCKIVIGNFPSRTEFYDLIEKFEEVTKQKGFNENAYVEHRQNCIDIFFENETFGLEFLKFVNYNKYSNPLYKGVKAILVYDEGKLNESKLGKSQSQGKIILNRSKLGKIRDLSISNQDSINSTIVEGRKRMKSSLKGEEFLQKYYKNLSSVRISNPYISDEEKRIEEIKKNKKKWIISHDFVRFNKVKDRDINNYVNLSKYSPPYKEFRDIKKEKWIGKKDFYAV